MARTGLVLHVVGTSGFSEFSNSNSLSVPAEGFEGDSDGSDRRLANTEFCSWVEGNYDVIHIVYTLASRGLF